MKTLLLFTTDSEAAVEEIKSRSGHVTHILSPRLLVANVPDDFDAATLRHATESAPPGLDDLTSLLVAAWTTPRSTAERAPVSWGSRERQYPRHPGNDPELAEQERIFPPATSSYLRGTVAIGLVIASGPVPSVQFSNNELVNTLSQVLTATQALASYEPLANVTFNYTVSIFSITAQPPSGTCASYESCERVFRDPALQKLGCSAGLAGVDQYNRRLITERGCDWAYSAFITKYPLYHFGYAGSGRLVIDYANDGWGSGQIYLVFAHETGHIFGAADEYHTDTYACSCGQSGFYNVYNYNCDSGCSPYSTIGCLMSHNTIGNVCPWSRGQLGWPFSYNVVGQSTRAAPALMSFNGKLYCAFRANDSSNTLFVMSSSDGQNWGPILNTNNQTQSGPALTVFNNKLYCAFQANDSSNTLFVMSSSDGQNWGPILNTNNQTQSGPALTVFNNKLYCAFRANDSSNTLFVMSSSDGQNWGPILNTNNQTQSGPALTVFNNKLYCAFRANDSSNTLFVMSSSDGQNWGPILNTNNQTQSGPALTVFNNKLYCAFRANDSSNTLFVMSSSDGQNWGPIRAVTGQSTSAQPSTTTLSQNLFIAFKSNDPSNTINITNSLGLL